jgi:hypothetical protein
LSTGLFSKHIKTSKHTFPANSFVQVLDPIHRHKMQKHSFTHTFCAKIKHGRLKKGGASTANAKKEHHHGGAVCHGILAHHPCCHRHCPLCHHRRCLPANLVTVSITADVAEWLD